MDEEKNELKAEILENVEEEKNDIKLEATTEIPKINNEDNKENIENQKKIRKHHSRIGIIFVIFILFLIAILSTIFALINSNNNKILGGIYIENESVAGMTDEEAKTYITEKYSNYLEKDIKLTINGETFDLSPKQIEINYNIEEAVKEAYSIGRNGGIFYNNIEIVKTFFKENKIELKFTHNDELLEKILKEFETKVPNSMIDNTYYIENDKLIITRGNAGVKIDIEYAKQQILEHIKKQEEKPIEIRIEYKECPEIDIEKIHKEVKCEPQNATFNKEPIEIIPHKVGIDFNVEEAKKVLENKKEEYEIKLKIIEPEIHTNEIGEEAFPDLLSVFSTKYDETNVPRSKNLKLAMSKLDGVVVMPGEVFSYNKTLGERTAKDGYQIANGFAGGKVVPMLAGGICQISSTLYDAVLYANLNIVERHNHMFQATYVDPGKDATVVYGSLDFKFENTRSYPIMLKTKIGGGLAEIKVFGIKEEIEYDVEIVTEVISYTPYKVQYQNDSSIAEGVEKVSQYGLQGCKSTTYRILRKNGQQVSKETLSTDTYSPLNKIVRRGVKKLEPIVTPQETQEQNEIIVNETVEENLNI